MDLIGPLAVIIPDYPATEAELDTSVIQGVLLGIGLRYTFEGGSSLDVTLATKGNTSLTKDILQLTGANTDGWFNVREPICDVLGSAIASQYAAGVAVFDQINIAIANGAGGDKLEVWFLVLD